jgi:hypothetical protein
MSTMPQDPTPPSGGTKMTFSGTPVVTASNGESGTRTPTGGGTPVRTKLVTHEDFPHQKIRVPVTPPAPDPAVAAAAFVEDTFRGIFKRRGIEYGPGSAIPEMADLFRKLYAPVLAAKDAEIARLGKLCGDYGTNIATQELTITELRIAVDYWIRCWNKQTELLDEELELTHKLHDELKLAAQLRRERDELKAQVERLETSLNRVLNSGSGGVEASQARHEAVQILGNKRH